MVTWPSRTATPPSIVFPPVSMPGKEVKWLPRDDLPAGPHVIHTTGDDRALVVAELRGWLTQVDPTGWEEPDWHFALELDTEWMRSAGIDPVQYAYPGDLRQVGTPDPAQIRRLSGPLTLHIELDAWPRADERVNPAMHKPGDWTFAHPELSPGKPDAVYPYDPRSYAFVDPAADPDPALKVGDYVSVWGSLVTDDPHAGIGPLLTQQFLALGLTRFRALYPDQVGRYATQAAAWIWGAGRAYSDPRNGGRWNEIHSPDWFGKLPARPQRRRCYQVSVCASKGPDDGAVTRYRTVLPAPQDPQDGSTLHFARYPTRWTRTSTVTSVTTTLSDSGPAAGLTVDVTVQCPGLLPPDALYFELFEIWWQEPVKHGGDLWFTSRAADGSWVPATDVSGQLSVTQTVTATAIAGNEHLSDLQVVLVTDQQVWHAARDSNGGWSPAGDMSGAAALPSGVRAAAGALLDDGSAHYIVLATDGAAWHTIRQADGSWQPAGNLSAALGVDSPIAWAALTTGPGAGEVDVTLVAFDPFEPPPDPTDMDLSGTGHSGAHDGVVHRPHPIPRITSRVLHTVRHADGGWGPVQDLTAATHDATALRVATTRDPADQATLVVSSGRDGALRCARWHANQSVDGVQDISAMYWSGHPDASIPAVTATGNGEVQVAVISRSDGTIRHAVRRPDGSWTPSGDLTGAAGLGAHATGIAVAADSAGTAHYVVIV